jgi:LPS export ABC transporter protein LptC
MIRIKKRTLYPFGLILLISILGCSIEKKRDALEDMEKNSHVVQEIWKSKMILSKAGNLQAVVHYEHMMKFDTSIVFFFDGGVLVDFYNSDGSHSSQLISDRGEYHEKTEDVIGRGNVRVESDTGEKLRTLVLKWDSRREKILSDTLVMIVTLDQDTLYGVGFESNADLSRRVIHKLTAVSTKHIDFDKIDDSFAKPVARDSVSTIDSTHTIEL